jgi:hypothetical protein
MAEYRKAAVWEILSSRGNNCMDEIRAETARETAEKALEEYLRSNTK